MKCKYCDGTGTSNWCINGTFLTCEYCNGTGETKDTNERENADESEQENYNDFKHGFLLGMLFSEMMELESEHNEMPKM